MALIYYITQVQFDFGAVVLARAECERVGMRRPLICTDRGVVATGLLERLRAALATDYDVEAISEEFEDAEMDIAGGERAATDRPVIRLVDHIVAEGIQSRASDIHIEPYENRMTVRFRIDGVLREVLQSKRAVAPLVVSRVKVMSDSSPLFDQKAYSPECAPTGSTPTSLAPSRCKVTGASQDRRM